MILPTSRRRPRIALLVTAVLHLAAPPIGVLCLAAPPFAGRCLAAPPDAVAAPQARPGPVIPRGEEHLRALAGEERRLAARHAAARGGTRQQDLFDVTWYSLDLEFDPAGGTVAGVVTIEASSLAPSGLTVAELDLDDAMTVSQVRVGGGPAVFSHAGGLLAVTLDRPYPAGEAFSVEVSYSGVPAGGLVFTTRGTGDPVIWSLSEPEDARLWWPCKDVPADKALGADFRWTVPKPLVAGAPGILEGTTDLGDRARYHWRFGYPIPSYLVSVVASNYTILQDEYRSRDGQTTIPVEYWCYPDREADCAASLEGTPDILGVLADLFGEYPFLSEKYGLAMCPLQGAMEHPTLVSYGSLFVDGSRAQDWVIAHESAHMWWGDLVTCGTWKDTWLNEGLTSHSEALWAEAVWGTDAYHQYMKNVFWDLYTASRGPVYDNARLFGRVVYHKGAWVQHMLRHVMGDAAFSAMLRDWAVSRAHQSAVTAEYQAHAEAWHGQDLDWFFSEWVYGAGMPDYEVLSSVAPLPPGGSRVYLRVIQKHTDAPPFAMPVDLRLTGPGGSTTQVLWVDGPSKDFVLDVAGTVESVSFDPDEWILRTLTETPWADLDGDGIPDDYDEDDDGDLVPDPEDCSPLDPLSGAPPDEVSGLRLAGAVDTVLTWQPARFAREYQVSRGLIRELGPGRYGACLSTGLADTKTSDPEPLNGGGFFYLVSGYDPVCGLSGSLGADSSGQPRVNTDPLACP